MATKITRSTYWSALALILLVIGVIYLVARDGKGGDEAPVPSPNFENVNESAP